MVLKLLQRSCELPARRNTVIPQQSRVLYPRMVSISFNEKWWIRFLDMKTVKGAERADGAERGRSGAERGGAGRSGAGRLLKAAQCSTRGVE